MQKGSVRIIGGKWRGRRLKIPLTVSGLRPTPDRVRETVFNWLSPVLNDANCLDLFAGTGAFGFEALSRGANTVVMMDSSSDVINNLKTAAQSFDAHDLKIYRAKVPVELGLAKSVYDIVFIDPPYESNLLLPTCHYLENEGFLAKKAYLYLEAKTNIKDNDLPHGWHIIKQLRAGAVHYHLALREKDND